MVAREYSPRCLPSGWMHLTGGRPNVTDRSVTSVYGGFGMRVWTQLQPVDTPSAKGWLFQVSVEKPTQQLTVRDPQLVMLGLFRNSKWSREVRKMWREIEEGQTWENRLAAGQKNFFAFASEIIPLDFSELPGVR